MIESPLPRIDRRSAVLHRLGLRPIFYRHALPCPRPGRGGERVHIYLDVSGSMNDVLSPLYGAVLDCKDLVHPTIHLFSTVVHDLPLTELRSGACMSTKGTSIECVAMHMKEHGVKRAVIVTDGFVGEPGTQSRETLKQSRLGVALLGRTTHRGDLDGVVNHWVEFGGGTR